MTNRTITDEDKANAARLAAIWKNKKGQLNLTQKSAADKLGYKSQSMVSMQLTGEVALNTDAILKWAQLLQVSPAELDPSMSGLSFTKGAMRLVKVAIIARMSGEPVGPFETVEIMTQMTRQVYGISVDTTGFEPFAKKGSTLIISRDEEPVSGDEVFIRLRTGSGFTHMLKHYITTDAVKGVAVVRDLFGGATEELCLDSIEVMDPIVSVERPAVNRPVRLHPREVNA